MKLWLDDIRDPPDGTWTVVRNADACIAQLRCAQEVGRPIEEASLDHDLGHCASCTECKGWGSPCGCRCHLSGNFVVNWMVSENMFPKRVRIHSMNPVGARNMQATLLRYGPYESVPWEPAHYEDEDTKATAAITRAERGEG